LFAPRNTASEKSDSDKKAVIKSLSEKIRKNTQKFVKKELLFSDNPSFEAIFLILLFYKGKFTVKDSKKHQKYVF